MSSKTRIQSAKRQGGEQWWINLPAVLAKSMQFTKGELVEWFIQDKETLILKRKLTKNDPGGSSSSSVG